MSTTPPWLAEGHRHINQREVPGPQSNPWIKALWTLDKAGAALWNQYGDDGKLPWCGAFTAMCVQRGGYPPPQHWYRAKAWLDWGVTLKTPCVGAIVVFGRDGGGHVGMLVGIDTQGRLLCLGGNQGDAVNIRAFDPSRVLGFRLPAAYAGPREPLPVMASAQASTSEA